LLYSPGFCFFTFSIAVSIAASGCLFSLPFGRVKTVHGKIMIVLAFQGIGFYCSPFSAKLMNLFAPIHCIWIVFSIKTASLVTGFGSGGQCSLKKE